MLPQDYGKIIIIGLCNSPNFLVNHFKREIKVISEKGFENEEILFDFNAVIEVMKNHIRELFVKQNGAYQELEEMNKGLPKVNRHINPKPDINKISIKIVKYPSGYIHDLSGLRREFTIPDFELVEQAFSEALEKTLPSKQPKTKTEQERPKIFEELFYNPEHAEPCLKILSELQAPVIDAINNYIGKAKGVFPLWIKVLKNHKPKPLIKHFKDTVYKDLLNQKIKGLNLSKDASEFRKK